MKLFIKTICAALITVLFISCNVLKIKSVKDKEVKGIPFYTQKQVIHQQTKYLYDWQEVVLYKEITNGDKKTEILLFKDYIEKGQDVALKKIENLINATTNEEIVLNYCRGLQKKQLNIEEIESSITEKNIIQNSWKKNVIIDYSTKYYLNAKMPWLGHSTLTQKLNDNGTLSESTATSDSQLDEIATSIASVVAPIADIKIAEIAQETALLSPPSEETVDDDTKSMDYNYYQYEKEKKPIVKYKLKISEKGYVYTFTKELEVGEEEKANTPIVFKLTQGNYTRTNWPIKTAAVSKPKNAIDVNARIILPKD